MNDGACPSAAIAKAQKIVEDGGNEKDIAYFVEHRGRFERTARRIAE